MSEYVAVRTVLPCPGCAYIHVLFSWTFGRMEEEIKGEIKESKS